MADADELYAARIADEADIGRKEAVRELAHFEAAELLVAVTATQRPRRRGRPPRLLERRDEEAWNALQALGERFRRPPCGTRSTVSCSSPAITAFETASSTWLEYRP